MYNREEEKGPGFWDPEGLYPPSKSELSVYLERELLGDEFTKIQCPLCDPTYDPTKVSLPDGCPIKADSSLIRLYLQHVSQVGMSLSALGSSDSQQQFSLRDVLKHISGHPYEPNDLHRFFAKLPRTMQGKGYKPKVLIVTANFDGTL